MTKYVPDLKSYMEKKKKISSKGCWVYPGFTTHAGYKVVNIVRDNYTFRSAHRLAYFVFNGPYDYTKCVLHKCDVPACINPNHLFLGTQADNVSDCIKKGRHRNQKDNITGEFHHSHKYKDFEVFCFQNLYDSGFRLCEIMKAFNLPQSTAYNICKKKIRRTVRI